MYKIVHKVPLDSTVWTANTAIITSVQAIVPVWPYLVGGTPRDKTLKKYIILFFCALHPHGKTKRTI